MAEVYIPIPIEEVSEAEELPSLTYRLDLDAGRIVGKVDGIKAVEQAVRKAIITPRFKCLIYDNQYGSEVEDAVICDDATPDYVRAAVEGFVRDALKPDTRVLSVGDFAFDFSSDGLGISFTCETIYGDMEIEEVI